MRRERQEGPTSRARGALDKAGEVREMFSRIAPAYDRLNRLLSFSFDRLWRRRVARRIVEGAAGGRIGRVLDVCTGTGDLVAACSRSGSWNLAIGVDFSHAMLQRAAIKKGKAQWVEADALGLPFADGAFDCATMAFGLRNLTDPEAGLKEMRRVVRPGGQVVVLEFGPDPGGWIGPFYRFYLRRIVPRVGNLLTASRAYEYLADTVRGFAEPQTVLEWMGRAGLVETTAEPLTGGIVLIYRGVAQR